MPDGNSPDTNIVPFPKLKATSYSQNYAPDALDNVITHIEPEPSAQIEKKELAPVVPAGDTNIIARYEPETIKDSGEEAKIIPFPQKKEQPKEDTATAAD